MFRSKLKLYIIIGYTAILADIVIASISFIFAIIIINFLFILYLYLLSLIFISLKIEYTVLLNIIIPIVPKYDNCNPIFVIKNGLYISIISSDRKIDVHISFFL